MKQLSAIITACIVSVTVLQAQNGRLLTKRPVVLSATEAWKNISANDSLLPDYSYLDKLEFFFITYVSDDSLEVKGMLVQPKATGTFPVIIFNRGGNKDFSRLTISSMISFTAKLASEGYVVIASQLRETLGAKGKDEYGGAELNDILALTTTIQQLEKADTARVGMFGWSRGGMMTYMALTQMPRIKTAVVGNGPTDLISLATARPKLERDVFATSIPGYEQNKETELKKRSAIYWPEQLNKKTSLLILCAVNDEQIPYTQSIQLYDKLKAIAYPATLLQFTTDHLFSDKKEELHAAVINWFNQHLR